MLNVSATRTKLPPASTLIRLHKLLLSARALSFLGLQYLAPSKCSLGSMAARGQQLDGVPGSEIKVRLPRLQFVAGTMNRSLFGGRSLVSLRHSADLLLHHICHRLQATTLWAAISHPVRDHKITK